MENTNTQGPGPVVLFGSGETSPAGRKVFDALLNQLPPAPRLALLETPAGFELNSARVIERVADSLRHRLQNHRPQVEAVAARKRGTAFSPDDPEIAAPLLAADLIFMGPGSPTYAVRQLQDSVAWDYTLARHRLGAALVFASAATIAVSSHALPVYEIYKVGEDPHWKTGLDFFGLYGIPLVFIPHWNNNDGGEELDTSRCFMGRPRFAELMAGLPPDLTVIGLDEKTALLIEPGGGTCRVLGLGGVTLIHTGHRHAGGDFVHGEEELASIAEARHGHVHRFENGDVFPMNVCCEFEVPVNGDGLPEEVWKRALESQARLAAEREAGPEAVEAPPEVLSLVAARAAARAAKDWPAADVLREQIAALGWRVVDMAEGARVEPLEG